MPRPVPSNKPVPAGVGAATVTDAHRSLIAALSHGARRAVILGTLAQRHPAYSQLKALSAVLAELCGASVGCITEGPNAAGAYLAGAVPHREAGGAPSASAGLSARQMLDSPLKAYVLLGAIDPANDLAVDPCALGLRGLGGCRDLAFAGSLAQRRARGAAHRHIRRNFGYVCECGRALAELGGRREVAGRGPARLESAASAREFFESARHRLRQLE